MTNTKEDVERVKFESVDRLPRDGYMGGDVYYVSAGDDRSGEYVRAIHHDALLARVTELEQEVAELSRADSSVDTERLEQVLIDIKTYGIGTEKADIPHLATLACDYLPDVIAAAIGSHGAFVIQQRRAAEWKAKALALTDNPEYDCTDGAHPAFWRGHDWTAKEFGRLGLLWLNGQDPHGSMKPEIQLIRDGIATLLKRASDAEQARDNELERLERFGKRVVELEAAAITFATKLVKKAVLHFPEDGEWFIVNNIAYPEKEYLLAQGILEHKPDAEHLVRWTAQATKEKG